MKRTEAGQRLLDLLHAADAGPLADTLAADWESSIDLIEVEAWRAAIDFVAERVAADKGVVWPGEVDTILDDGRLPVGPHRVDVPQPAGPSRAVLDRVEHKASQVIEALAVPAVRYGLGRMTYITGLISETIIANRDAIPADLRAVIIRDITEAEERDVLGHPVDAKAWLALREALRLEDVKGGQERQA